MLNKCEVSVFHHLHPWKNPGNFFFGGVGLEVEGPCLTISLLSIHYQLGGFQDDPTRQLPVDEVSTSQKLSVVLRAIPFHGGSPERVDS